MWGLASFSDVYLSRRGLLYTALELSVPILSPNGSLFAKDIFWPAAGKVSKDAVSAHRRDHTHTHTHTHSGAFETTVCYFASSSVALCYYEIETILGCPEKLGILPPTHTHTHIHIQAHSRMCGWH